ncbi:hypothetical protein PUN4_280296 [Paraburkholderia unamae]|nr:hypothetical protein PUN4_280296 [Paraburkholderia unamae]
MPPSNRPWRNRATLSATAFSAGLRGTARNPEKTRMCRSSSSAASLVFASTKGSTLSSVSRLEPQNWLGALARRSLPVAGICGTGPHQNPQVAVEVERRCAKEWCIPHQRIAHHENGKLGWNHRTGMAAVALADSARLGRGMPVDVGHKASAHDPGLFRESMWGTNDSSAVPDRIAPSGNAALKPVSGSHQPTPEW